MNQEMEFKNTFKIYISFLILGVKLSAGLTDTFYKKIKEWRRLTCV